MGWRTATEVIASTLPHRCSASRAPPRGTWRCAARQLSFERLRGRREVGGREVARAAARRRWHTRMSTPPSASRASRTNCARTGFGGHVGDERDRPGPMSAAAASIRSRTGCRSRRCTPSSASAARGGETRARCDAAATAARLPRCRDPCQRSFCAVARVRVDRPGAVSVSDTAPGGRCAAPMISAQIDTAVSSGVRAPMSRPIGAWIRARLVVGDAGLAEALRPLGVRRPRAHGARGTRRRSRASRRWRARRTWCRGSARTPRRAVRARRRPSRGSGWATR